MPKKTDEVVKEENKVKEEEVTEKIKEKKVEEEKPAIKKKTTRREAKKEDVTYFAGTGRRKLSVARVRILPGSGTFLINKKSLEEYFPRQISRIAITMPLEVTSNMGKYDVFASVSGGGISGQAGAVTLGIARALVEVDPKNRLELKRKGLLTRDPRMVERKKYGYKKARKKPQFSKR